MRKIVFFCIPAHGHTNPTLPVVRRLADLGHEVIYYSFEPFREEIEAAGARYMACDRFDMGAPEAGAAVAKDISAAAELIARTTLSMDAQVLEELREIGPDAIVADSVAYWGKLFARKLGVPLVCSNTTFAFNRHSARVMKQGLADLFGLLFKLPKANRALRPLRAAGYEVGGIMEILSADPATPTVVYTSKLFQPAAETFSDKYAFVGPCLRPAGEPWPKGDAPRVYVSMGTVLGGEEAFFRSCAEAFSDGAFDVVISAGETPVPDALPKNVRAYRRVDQLAVLQSADAFITHCGMNSASEALYYGVPLAMRPLTPEEGGVANRVSELGAGLMLEAADPAAIRRTVDALVREASYRAAAKRIGDSFRQCGGTGAAVDAILAACK